MFYSCLHQTTHHIEIFEVFFDYTHNDRLFMFAETTTSLIKLMDPKSQILLKDVSNNTNE